MNKTGVTIACMAVVLATLSCSLFTGNPQSDELVFSPDELPEGQVGLPYKAVLTLSNQHTPAFQMDTGENSLPPGLTGSFDEDGQTYTISGTPTQAGTYPFKISALCYGTNTSGQRGEKEYEIVIT